MALSDEAQTLAQRGPANERIPRPPPKTQPAATTLLFVMPCV